MINLFSIFLDTNGAVNEREADLARNRLFAFCFAEKLVWWLGEK
jgi:hypothetical protein